MSLVRVSFNYGIYANIFAKQCEWCLHLQRLPTIIQQNTCELDIVLTRTANILTNNELVKLMTL